MRKIYISILPLLLLSFLAVAQPGKIVESWGELAAKGDFLFEQGDYYQAADYYTDALKLNTNDVELKAKQAESLRLGREYKRAALAYNSIRKRIARGKVNRSEYPLIDFHYASMLKQAGEYEEAEEAFFVFAEEYDGSQGEEYRELAKTEYEGCKLARTQMKDIVRVKELDNLSNKVNSKYTESAPFPLPDGRLMFSSLKSGEPIALDNETIRAELYAATIEDLKRVRSVEKLNIPVRDDGQHVGSGALSPDGQRLYLTICDRDGAGVSNCTIHVSERNGDNEKFYWGRPDKLGNAVNMEGYQSVTPFVERGPGGTDILYFASNRPGGKGGMDIYAATGAAPGEFNGTFNLGDAVNTAGNELSPWIDDAEGYEDSRPRLYFSSNGHPSLGGLDIFMSFRNGTTFTEWGKAQNAGKQINSPTDDTYFIMDGTKTKAYLVSNRAGGYSIAGRTCCDDIFVAELEPPVLEKIIIADLLGKVYDENKKALQGTSLNLYDSTTGKSLYGDATTGVTGFSFESLPLNRDYILELRVPDYEPQDYRFSTKGLTDSKIFQKDFFLKKKNVPPPPPTGCDVLGTVLADSGTGAKSPLSGATVKVYKTTSGRQELLETLTSDASGNFSLNLKAEETYRLVASKGGYLNESSTQSTKGAGFNCKKIIAMSVKEKRKNVVFNIENILYDYNSAALRPESVVSLEKLRTVLNDNPNIVIELRSHTDSKGSDSYNMDLSQKRAQSVVDWLITNGISSSRLVARGYGESLPKVPNTNPDGSDNPENRQINRRTEFTIIGGMN